MREKFIQHLIDLGWKKDEKFTAENNDDKYNIIDEISDECTDFWKNSFTVPEGERMVRHAMYEFSDEVIKKFIKKINRDAMYKKILGS